VSRPHPFGLDAALRLDLASEENRPLLLSYTIASLLALAWLALVHIVPVPLRPVPVDFVAIITFAPQPLAPAAPSIAVPTARARDGVRRETPSTQSRGGGTVRDMFTGNSGLVDAGNILRNVDVEPTSSARGEAARLKVGLGTGADSRTPGLTRPGGGPLAGAGVGNVRDGGVSRHVLTIGAPDVRAVAVGSATGSAAEMGQTARAHVPQLARCYHEEGLSRNRSLAGLVRLALTVEAGRVTSATIVDRSWAGAGAAEAESCLLRAVRGWRLGSSDARIVLPLSFTSPVRGSP
jgi:hypothetical protein